MPITEVELDKLEDSKPLRVELDGVGVVVVKTEEGVFAFEDTCPHAGWRLSAGDMVGGLLECPGHGWQFKLDDGECADVPAYCLKPVTVTLVGDRVRLECASTI